MNILCRSLFTVFFLLVALFLGVVSNAYAISVSNDVTLTIPSTPAGATANVVMRSGSSFSSLTVTATNFSITLGSSDTATLDSSEGKLFTNDQGIATSCGESSSIVLTASKTYVISMGGGCVLSGGGGGAPPPSTTPPPSSGGGGGTVSSPPVEPATPATPAIPATPTESPATPATPAAPAAPAIANSPVFNSDLEVGTRGDDVTRLQQLLASDASLYPEGLITGYFGKATQAAVRRFQQKQGLPAVGRVGPQTRAKLAEIFGSSSSGAITQPPPVSSQSYVFTRELSFGVEGDDVTQLQLFLARDSKIYPEGRVTGYFGSATLAAVKRLQAEHGLPSVGRVGPLTLALLNQLLGSAPVSPPVNTPATQSNEQKLQDLLDQLSNIQQQINSAQSQ